MIALPTMKSGATPARPLRARAGIGLLAAGLLGAGGAVFIPAQAQETVIAYEVQAETVGNQDFSGMLGMDFDVANPIIITRVGVFDSGSDGLNRVIYAGLWNRETQTEILFVEFRPDDPGELVGGSRFKALPEPIRLEAGFEGTVTADGYGPDEPLLNSHGVEDDVVWTTNDGNGSIRFVGSGRWGVTPGAFPGTPDGGPANRYAAGTFYFEPIAVSEPPVLTITRVGADTLKIEWTVGGVLQSSASITEGWEDVDGASSGVEVPVTGDARFYRVR